jgi:leucyl-tRNA synthetase
VNPFNGAEIPLFIADYVLMGYGTGAIMAVPGEDQRDWEFAREHGLSIIETVQRPPGYTGEAYTGDGIKINSGFLDGLTVAAAKRRAIDWLRERGIGEAKINYRLRDWGISRQRYWGAPIPVLYCEACGMVPEKEENLPVVLPRDVQISGKGGTPLADVATFVRARCPRCGGPARRETDTMDTFVESSWYFLRYCSPRFEGGMFERSAAEYWMPVDQYIGGIEHAVLHLLYARFYTKVLRDLGLVKVDEPFLALLSQGMVIKDGAKMSKSKGNVVDPDDLIHTFGADTARLFSLFAAPPEKDLDWNDHGVEGASRFLNRIWRFAVAHAEELRSASPVPAGRLSDDARAFRRTIHETINRVTTDIENEFHFNTAISAVMELVNALHTFEASSQDRVPLDERRALLREAIDTLLLLLGPFCPHITEELWQLLGHTQSLFAEPWPQPEVGALAREEVTVVVQVDGKVRSRLTVGVGTAEHRVKTLALADERVQPWLAGRQVARVVVVPGRLVNVVTSAG